MSGLAVDGRTDVLGRDDVEGLAIVKSSTLASELAVLVAGRSVADNPASISSINTPLESGC